MSELAHVRRLARIDVTRMLRKNLDLAGGGSIVSVVMYVLLLLLGTLGGGYLAFRAGEEAALGTIAVGPFQALETLRGLLALVWLVFLLVLFVRAFSQRGVLPEPAAILPVVQTREAFVGLLLAEYAYVLVWLFVPAVGIGAGFALGSGVLWPAVTVPLAVLAMGVSVVGVGFTLGLAFRHVVSRFAFVARHRGALVLLVFLVYFVGLTTGEVNELMVSLFEPMAASPVGWFADLALYGSPALDPPLANAVGALGLSVALALASVVAGSWVADRHWFSDPATAGEEPRAATAADAAPGVERRLAPVFGTATASLVAVAWRRAIRTPLKFLYAAYPFLVLAGLFADIVRTGTVPEFLPYAIVLFVAWGAGVVFTLNPLGDQGAALASSLLSLVDGRTFVRATVLASLLVAVPVGVVATAAVAVLSPLDATTAAVLVASVPVALGLSAALSVGIGMAFPRFEATQVTRSMSTVLPSRWGFVLFTLYLFLTAGAGAAAVEPVVRQVGAAVLSFLLPFGLSVSAPTLGTVAAVVLVPLLVAPGVSYRYAVRRFDGYTLS